MERTIRNLRRERCAVRAAQRAMDRRPGIGVDCWRGLANTIFITAGFVAFGCAVFFALGGTIR